MMRGARTWAVAVRRPSGAIYLERNPVSDFPDRHPLFRKPLFRGMFGLVDALSIGTRALSISANQSAAEEDQLSSRQMGGSMLIAALLFIGVFIVLPNAGLALLSDVLGSGLVYHLVEGVVRMGIFLLYLLAISLVGDIQRVFRYHGAEHMTIHAFEHGDPLDTAHVLPYPTAHPRCGTAFLLLVVVIAIASFAFIPRINVVVDLAIRLVLVLPVAALSYEVLKLGARHEGNPLMRLIVVPGLFLQRLTTRRPDEPMLEVAIASLEEALTGDGAPETV